MVQFGQVESCGPQTVFIYFLANNISYCLEEGVKSAGSVVLFGSHIFLLN